MSNATTRGAHGTADLTDLDLWADGPPHEIFAHLRSTSPVAWNPSADGPGFWSVTRGADIVTVSNDAGAFSSARGGIFLHPDALGPLEFMQNLPIVKDPPGHARFREIVALTFRAHNLQHLEQAIEDVTDEVLASALQHGSCELVSELAEPVPARVMARMLGAEEDDARSLVGWTELIQTGITYSRDVRPTFKQMGEFLHKIVDRQVIRGLDSLAQTLPRAEIDGAPLTEDELALYFALLLYAGIGPTRNAISSAVLALIEHPDQQAALRRSSQRIVSARSGRPTPALEEILRWTTPVNYLARTATRETVLSDVRVREGDRLVLWYASASRDPEVFDGADRFDVTRPIVSGSHFAFGGGGPHHCQGGFLATKLLSVTLTKLLSRSGEIRLDGDVERVRSAFANQLTALPVSMTSA